MFFEDDSHINDTPWILKKNTVKIEIVVIGDSSWLIAAAYTLQLVCFMLLIV